MAAAYAAVVSLMNTIDLFQINHPRIFISSFDNNQIQSLHEYAVFLQHFLEESRRQQEDLEILIAAAALAAEDVIESHATNQILAESTGESSSSSLLDLQKVLQDMDSVTEKVMEVMKVKEMTAYNMHQQPTNPMPMTTSTLSTTGKSTMVGFDDNLIRLMDMLTGHQSDRQIIPVTGMGGIGKTTLTKNVYENLAIVKHFDICGWAVVSQQYNVRGILVELLSCLEEQEKSAMDQTTEQQIGLKLHQFLSRRRYLIVLDDVWSIEAWDKINFFFPDNKNRSRIVVTTRESLVANHFGSLSFVMNFLDEDQSWNLFCEKTFGQQDYCPPEFEDIGKQIIKKCKGLPLSIVVIGGLLQKSNRSLEYWKNIANDLNSILLNSGNNESCLNILYLSYSHLPVHLKPCFLYMGIFCEDHKIRVSELIKLWVAEGFLKPNKPQSLEEVAECYLKDLVDKNLILVDSLTPIGKIKFCNIHDLLRDLCLKVYEKEKLLCFTRVLHGFGHIDEQRRVVFCKSKLEDEDDPVVFQALRLGLLSRALLFDGDEVRKILDVWRRSFSECEGDPLKPIFQQVRYIACNGVPRNSWNSSALLSYISLLWNLQTLVISTGVSMSFVAPSEIWEMRQLRHVRVDLYISLPDPPPSDHQQDDVLQNLQTLGNVVNLSLSEEVCRRIPNIKKLRTVYGTLSESVSKDCVYNFRCFDKLESLQCMFDSKFAGDNLLQKLTFPSSLKRLELAKSRLRWENLSFIGSLPHLEVLKLQLDSVRGGEWNPIKGQFLQLKLLEIWKCHDFIYWNADNSHFPVLEKLILGKLNEFNEIPLSIGDIPTLRDIQVSWCSESAAISAVEILEQRESYGNEDIKVSVTFKNKSTLSRFKKKVDLRSGNIRYFINKPSR